jgi:hypothetical protein
MNPELGDAQPVSTDDAEVPAATGTKVGRRPAGFRISAVRDVVIPLPFDEVLGVVRDIELLEEVERKARRVSVHPTGPGVGWYRVGGKLCRLVPWDGEFAYEQHAHGWHSEDLHPRADGWRVSGGFLVSRVDAANSRVTHYEDYVIPLRLRPLRPLLSVYMRRSQVGEMRDLALLVQRTVASHAAVATP